MDHGSILSATGLVVQAVTAIATGAAAGGVVYAGIVWRQKAQAASIRRTERCVMFLAEVMIEVVQHHNELHPDFSIDVSKIAKLLFDNGNGGGK